MNAKNTFTLSKTFIYTVITVLMLYIASTQYIIYKQDRLVKVLDYTLGGVLYWCMMGSTGK
jgi:hypothetical protein